MRFAICLVVGGCLLVASASLAGARPGGRTASGPPRTPSAGPTLSAARPGAPLPSVHKTAPGGDEPNRSPFGKAKVMHAGETPHTPGAASPRTQNARSRRAPPSSAAALQNRRGTAAARTQPFTAEWYLDHPQAWQATHPHADAWAVATVASVANWLGVAYVADTMSESGYVILEGELAAAPAADAAGKPVQARVIEHGLDLPQAGPELMLGVFGLSTGEETAPAILVQLALNKDHELVGAHYDLATDLVQPIHGVFDLAGQQVAWKVGAPGRVEYRAELFDLTLNEFPIAVRLSDGQEQTWHAKRQDRPSTGFLRPQAK